MSSRPTENITQEQHYFRNELNIQYDWDTFSRLNSKLPKAYQWNELNPFQSLFHKFDAIDNKKFVSADEHFEAVYTEEHYLVDAQSSSVNMGTYNYYGPTDAGKHARIDVHPWIQWGNTPSR
jgi:hypothetical protein